VAAVEYSSDIIVWAPGIPPGEDRWVSYSSTPERDWAFRAVTVSVRGSKIVTAGTESRMTVTRVDIQMLETDAFLIIFFRNMGPAPVPYTIVTIGSISFS